MSAAGVFTRRRRLTFVEKSSGEVSDGTAWPMLVTPDQLAEVMYRVRNSELKSGSASATYSAIPSGYESITVSATGGSPPTDLFETWDDGAVEDGDVFTAAVFYRGYMTALDKYFYDAGGSLGPMPDWGSDYFGEIYEKRDRRYMWGDVDQSHYYIREAADNERVMWAFRDYIPPEVPLPGYYDEGFQISNGELSYGYNISTFRTGLSMAGYAQADPYVGALGAIGHYGVTGSVYISYLELSGDAWESSFALEILPEVAWVDDDGSGNPLSSGNRLYLGVIFSADAQFGPYVKISAQADSGSFNGSPSEMLDGNLILKLSGVGNEISCPIYGAMEPGLMSITSTDWIFEATEWFPYAKNSPPVPVWDTATGLPL